MGRWAGVAILSLVAEASLHADLDRLAKVKGDNGSEIAVADRYGHPPNDILQPTELKSGETVIVRKGTAEIIFYGQARQPHPGSVQAANPPNTGYYVYRAPARVTITEQKPIEDKPAYLISFTPNDPHGISSGPRQPSGQVDAFTRLLNEAWSLEATDPEQALKRYDELEGEEGPAAWIARRKAAVRQRIEFLADQKNAQTLSPKPQTHALVVGISQYQWLGSAQQLAGPEQDADYFSRYLLTERGGASENPGNVTTLINEAATAASIRLHLRRAAEQVRVGDRFFFFISAHGLALNRNDGFIVAYDSRPDIRGSLLPMDEIADLLKNIRAMGATVFVFADVCHAGLIENRNFANSSLKALAGGISGLLAGDKKAPSFEKRDLPGHEGHAHGLFSYYLVSALSERTRGDAPDMTISQLRATMWQLGAESLATRPVSLGNPDETVADLRKPGATTHGYRPPQFLVDPLTTESADLELARLKALPNQDSEEWKAKRDQLELRMEQQAQQTILRYLAADEIDAKQETAEFRLAEHLFGTAALLHPSLDLDVRRMFCAAQVAILEKSYDKGLALLYDAQEIDGFEGYIYNALGIAQLEQSRQLSDVAAAEKSFREAILLDPYWSYPRHNLALASHWSGNDGEARRAYNESIQFAGYYGLNTGQSRHNLGILLQREQQWGAAEQAFGEAVKEFEQYRNFLTGVEQQAHVAGLTSREAWAKERKGIVAWNEAEAENALGSLYASRGKLGSARTEYQRALQLVSDLPSAEQNLKTIGAGQAQKKRGDRTPDRQGSTSP
jgi:Flp pilus assembly protein TadD